MKLSAVFSLALDSSPAAVSIRGRSVSPRLHEKRRVRGTVPPPAAARAHAGVTQVAAGAERIAEHLLPFGRSDGPGGCSPSLGAAAVAAQRRDVETAQPTAPCHIQR